MNLMQTAAVAVVVVAGFAGTGVAVPTGDGFGAADCEQNPTPACELYAGSNPNPPPPASEGAAPAPPGIEKGGRAVPAAPPPVCNYVRSQFQPPPGGVQTVALVRGLVDARMPVRPASVVASGVARPKQGSDGAWYDWVCDDSKTRNAVYRPPVWIPNGQQPAPQLPSPAELAERARRQLRLPSPAIAASPTGTQLVNLPTWLWLAGGWTPTSATAAVPGFSVTATATPTSVTWSMGDGSEVTCNGAGTPFTPGGDPVAASPDCGHVYRVSSAGRAGEVFAVSATVRWTVTWTGAGQGGAFPDLTATSTAAFRVAEAQALNAGGG
jgi:hypothetical protein